MGHGRKLSGAERHAVGTQLDSKNEDPLGRTRKDVEKEHQVPLALGSERTTTSLRTLIRIEKKETKRKRNTPKTKTRKITSMVVTSTVVARPLV